MTKLIDKLNLIKNPFYTWFEGASVKENYPKWLLEGNKEKSLLFIKSCEHLLSDDGTILGNIDMLRGICDRIFLNCINLVVFNIKIKDDSLVNDIKFHYSNFQNILFNELEGFILMKPNYVPTLRDVSIFCIKNTITSSLNLIKRQCGYKISYKPLLHFYKDHKKMGDCVIWDPQLIKKLEIISKNLPHTLRDCLKLQILKVDYKFGIIS